MNPRLDALHAYPFEKLDAVKATLTMRTNAAHVALSLGEPKHAAPAFVIEALADPARIARSLGTYPPTRGSEDLRNAIADWATVRYGLQAGSLDAKRHVLPVNGTREALFSFAQAVIDPAEGAVVVMPNPFYQIYEGAALLAGALPYYVPCTEERRFLPDFEAVPDEVWARTRMVYICSPGNPTGAVMDLASLRALIERADAFDFVIASDECYSEIYMDEGAPPAGLLQACASMGRHDYRRCVVFHSLSKRSNLPGLRSGFVAGDADVLARYYQYRTYHGCAMAANVGEASALAWRDEAHVVANRAAYREKFERVLAIFDGVLDVAAPDASFYLWPRTPIPEVEFAARLFAEEHVTVLPGSFLSRATLRHDAALGSAPDPGAHRVRMALVAGLDECVEAAQRVRRFVERL